MVVLQGALGALLLAASASKLLSPEAFAESIANYRLLPAQANQFLAVVLPWWEGMAGLLLLFRLWSRAASLVSVLLFGAFSFAVASALLRQLDIGCGCFGTSGGSTVGAQTLAVDLFGLTAAAALAWTQGSRIPSGHPEV